MKYKLFNDGICNSLDDLEPSVWERGYYCETKEFGMNYIFLKNKKILSFRKRATRKLKRKSY